MQPVSWQERFLFKIEVIPFHSCWEWTAALNGAGYGIFCRVGQKTEKAHRISYEMFRGEIPNGLFVCHSCDNRSCVNPGHLFLGSNLDNVRDMISKNRQPLVPAMGGWNKKTYSEDIIKLLGTIADIEIAKLVGVSKYAIQNERKRRNIPSFPCATRFKKGSPHPRWHKRNGGI